jgi:hypothetical protein
MEWAHSFGKDREPSLEDIAAFIGSSLWSDLNSFLQGAYNAEPKRSYSTCAGAPGWNVKYKKSGKSLCTLYPKAGYFTALVVIGNKEVTETEIWLPNLCPEIREQYDRVPFACGGKWLMIDVTSADTLSDVKRLIGIRVKPKYEERQYAGERP